MAEYALRLRRKQYAAYEQRLVAIDIDVGEEKWRDAAA